MTTLPDDILYLLIRDYGSHEFYLVNKRYSRYVIQHIDKIFAKNSFTSIVSYDCPTTLQLAKYCKIPILLELYALPPLSIETLRMLYNIRRYINCEIEFPLGSRYGYARGAGITVIPAYLIELGWIYDY